HIKSLLIRIVLYLLMYTDTIFVELYRHIRYLYSFPTRRSSDLKEDVGAYLDEAPVSLSLFTPDLDLCDISRVEVLRGPLGTAQQDRKSTRLNSSHVAISYAVFCLKKKIH